MTRCSVFCLGIMRWCPNKLLVPRRVGQWKMPKGGGKKVGGRIDVVDCKVEWEEQVGVIL